MRKGETTNAISRARLARSLWFLDSRESFLAQLQKEIAAERDKAMRAGFRFAVRLNGTADIPWERVAPELFERFPDVTFYDYTKGLHRVGERLPPNYHLTLSRSELNERELAMMLGNGTCRANIAVVFERLPETYLGRRVVVGDDTDLRFLDPAGVVVGLTAKGKAKQDSSGFVVRGIA